MHGRDHARAIPLLAIACLILAGAAQAESAGGTAPNWSAKCADGSRIEFHDVLEKGPVLVSFWATWCKPCLRELPHLEDLQERFGERMTVLAVNTDGTRSVGKVRPYLKSKGLDLRVPMDTSGDLKRLLQIGNSIPYVILYDAEGNEVYRHMGYKDGDEQELGRKIATLLGDEES